jgi:hypothetical protein
MVSSVLGTTRTVPLLDPALVQRVLIEKELIPRPETPAPTGGTNVTTDGNRTQMQVPIPNQSGQGR